VLELSSAKVFVPSQSFLGTGVMLAGVCERNLGRAKGDRTTNDRHSYGGDEG
jgi:hypothetical protein